MSEKDTHENIYMDVGCKLGLTMNTTVKNKIHISNCIILLNNNYMPRLNNNYDSSMAYFDSNRMTTHGLKEQNHIIPFE